MEAPATNQTSFFFIPERSSRSRPGAKQLVIRESFQVGDESPSQFSREYTRFFGLPPVSDTKRIAESRI
jgi:hypothetical protein